MFIEQTIIVQSRIGISLEMVFFQKLAQGGWYVCPLWNSIFRVYSSSRLSNDTWEDMEMSFAMRHSAQWEMESERTSRGSLVSTVEVGSDDE